MFLKRLVVGLTRLDERGGEGLPLLTGRVASPTLTRQIAEFLRRYPQASWHLYEPTDDAARAGAAPAYGLHLVRVGRTWAILLSADETKGKEELEYPLSEKVSRALDRYLEAFRPAIYGTGRHWGVWASAKGTPATGHALYDAVCRRTRIEFGESMNLHLFRNAAFIFLAFYAPNQVRVGRDLLGHKHLHTGEKFYASAQTVLASRLVADILERNPGVPALLTSTGTNSRNESP